MTKSKIRGFISEVYTTKFDNKNKNKNILLLEMHISQLEFWSILEKVMNIKWFFKIFPW